ncbi:ribokinase RbsK [Gottschalkia purinilytica]|uniref:Ribokinase RbsK n=1 Tax=Gottschalkia purinilytica TaxID=1503 RepID=A0A0L0WCS9_GOTPU|nr:carbohydrate kinase family protein [Gottschalkia purinilytica]KNF09272.1 ribokinase RbsK [Gottschalkia purinilytica]
MAKILGLGTAAIDTILKCDNIPKEDGTSLIREEKVLPGGSCANVLVTLSRLNVDTSLLVKIGDDQYGKVLLEDLSNNRISTDNIVTNKGGTTLRTFIAVGEKGKKMIFSNVGDSLMNLKEEEVNEDMLDDVDVFYTDMFPVKPAIKLGKICREKGIKVVVNLQSTPDRMEALGVTLEEIEEMMSLSDIICGYGDGMLELAGQKDYESSAITVFEKYRPKLGVIVTCGDKGAIWRNSKETISCPSFKVNAIDTTGAGDAFLGGVIYSMLIKKAPVKDSLVFANACAAIKCTQLGPRIHVTLNEVKECITKSK